MGDCFIGGSMQDIGPKIFELKFLLWGLYTSSEALKFFFETLETVSDPLVSVPDLVQKFFQGFFGGFFRVFEAFMGFWCFCAP